LSFASIGVKVASVGSWVFEVNAIGIRSGDRTCSLSGLRNVWRTACQFGVRASRGFETCLVSFAGRVVSVIVPYSGLGRYGILLEVGV